MKKKSITVKKIRPLRLLEKIGVHEPMPNWYAFKLYS